MQTPLEISFHNMDRTEMVASRLRERVARLEKFYGRATSCHVTVEIPHRRKQTGNTYQVRIEVRVPGTELTVNNRPGDVNAHEDVLVAIRDAFDAMERQMKKWKLKASGDVKVHDQPVQGKVADIHPDRDYGHIATTDGRLIYFHRNAVLTDGFDTLKTDDPVELVIRYGDAEDGPHASTVRPIGPMRYVDKP